MKFTQEELNNIINDYKNGMTPKEMSIKYNRNSGTIIGKLQDLGVYKNTKYRFTEDDVEFLKQYYPIGDFEMILKRFPNHTKQSIQIFCSKHKISANYYNDKKWTDEELYIVEKYYYEKSLIELVSMMNNRHSADAIQTKALKYFNYSKDRTWTDDELDILYEYYSVESIDDVCKRLSNRTRDSIIGKANQLNIKSYFWLNTYWSDEDSKILEDNWEIMSDNELAELLNKNIGSIKERRWLLGLPRVKHYNEATYNDVKKYIRGNIGIWKSDSMKSCDYKCILTGEKDFHIHHLYSFSFIFDNIIEQNDIILKDNFSDYTPYELSFILQKFIEEQSKYPLGICVRPDIHNLFHSIYGQRVIPEMWYRFEKDYKEGKYTN